MEDLKAQTVGIERGRIGDRFGSFLKGRNPLLGWKHPRAHILKGKSLKKKEIRRKGDDAFTQNCLFSSFFFVSLFFDSFL